MQHPSGFISVGLKVCFRSECYENYRNLFCTESSRKVIVGLVIPMMTAHASPHSRVTVIDAVYEIRPHTASLYWGFPEA